MNLPVLKLRSANAKVDITQVGEAVIIVSTKDGSVPLTASELEYAVKQKQRDVAVLQAVSGERELWGAA